MDQNDTRKKLPSRRVYECEHYEFEYNDLGKYYWCHNPDNPSGRCDVEWTVCMEFCPYFSKKGKSYRVLEITERDRRLMDEAKRKLEMYKSAKAAEKAAVDKAEYELYLLLKKRYEGRLTHPHISP